MMTRVSRVRYTDYGYPAPELTDAQQEPLKDKPQNQEQRELIRTILEDVYTRVLRRNWYGGVVIEFAVEDGIIQQDVTEHTRRKRRS